VIDEAFDRVPDKLIGDKGFDSQKLADELGTRDIELIAPRRNTTRSRKQDGRKLRRYTRRWKVERLFAWLKRYRRINTRWDHKAQNFLGFLHLGCIALLVRRF
jgi:transposase